MNPTALVTFFESHRDRQDPLVLVTVYDTAGSTYSKAGALMLVNQQGVFRGMLSGGCLEGDLAIRAQQVLEVGAAQTVTYDLADDGDEIWGMGVGCDGLMRVLLLPLRPQDGYAPFDQIATIWAGDIAARVAIPFPDNEVGEIVLHIEPPPRILVLGAGLDAEPIVRFAAELGWRCSVYDHRPAYIERGDFGAAVDTFCGPAEQMAEQIDVAKYAAAIVMSHHLVSDRVYLQQLADSNLPYIALLGPRHRRDRLLDELGEAAGRLQRRLRGPAGIDIGGRGPAPIALSIIAEIQASLTSRD